MVAKIFAVIFAISVSAIGSLYLSSIFVNFCIKRNISKQVLSFTYAVETLVKDPVQLRITLLVFVLLLIGMIYVLFIGGVKTHKSELIDITPAISIPAVAGQKQYGSARFMNNTEIDKSFKHITIDHNHPTIKTLINDGKLDKKGIAKKVVRASKPLSISPIKNLEGNIPVRYVKQDSKEHLLAIAEDVHTLIVGATRSGKTRTLVLQGACIQALCGYDMFFSDPKGELFQYMYPFLEKLGYSVLAIDFKNPERSIKYNYLQQIIDSVEEGNISKAISATWDIVECFVEKSTGHQDPLWSNGEKATMASAILIVVYDNSTYGLKKQYPEKSDVEIKKLYETKHRYYQNMTNVSEFVSSSNKDVILDDKSKETRLSQIIEQLPHQHPARMVMATVDSAPEKTRGSFITSALATLRLFSDTSISSMSTSTHSDFFDVTKKKAIFVILPDEKTTYYPLASIIVNQYYQYLVSVADKRGGRLVRDFNFNLDEFGNFTQIQGFDNKMTVGAGRGIHFNLYIQSFEQLGVKYTKEVSSIIQGNCHFLIYLKSSDRDTKDKLSHSLGKYTCMGVGSSNSDNGKLGLTSGSYSSSTSLLARDLLTADEIGKIDRPYMLVIADNGFPCVTKSPDISQWSFNDMLGLGNKKHNTKLREIRENNRHVYDIDVVPTWDYKIMYNIGGAVTQDNTVETEIKEGIQRSKKSFSISEMLQMNEQQLSSIGKDDYEVDF